MKVNALQVRQSFGKILKKLVASDEPIIIEKGRRPVAVLISLKTFEERFIDRREKEKRDELLKRFEKLSDVPARPTLEVIRELRYGSHH